MSIYGFVIVRFQSASKAPKGLHFLEYVGKNLHENKVSGKWISVNAYCSFF